MKEKLSSRIDLNYKIISTVIFAIAFGFGLFYYSELKHDNPKDLWTTNIICIGACIMGWLIGIITTPYDKTDESKLIKFSSMIGTFISGYLLSKVDGIIVKVLEPDLVLNTLIGIRIFLFLSYFILTWIVVFVFRNYSEVKNKNKPEGNEVLNEQTEKKEDSPQSQTSSI